jgi:hypothetical protein
VETMRLMRIAALALVFVPAALTAKAAPGLQAQVTDISAAKKKPKAKAPKEEYLKAAPGTGPSGPKN